MTAREHGLLARYVPEGERVVERIKPSPLSIILLPIWTLVVLLAVASVGLWLGGAWGARLATTALLFALARLFWSWLEWLARLYVLTDARIVRVTGVLRQLATDVPLDRVQTVVIHRLIRERLFGLGTLAFATAGTGGFEAAWLMVPRPERLAHRVRSTIRRGTEAAPRRPTVVGLAGGIGAGKSAVARLLAELGAVVVDSDAQAKAALDRPEVRDELVAWWGPRVLGAGGGIDRKQVAEIIFGDEEERRRLERLVHPLVRHRRDELVRRAARAGAPAVIVDAPLLFEAGIDAECDVVVFVDSPRGERARRVLESRGWDEAELSRRESAQWPIDQKRAKADEVVSNEGDEGALRRAVGEVWERILDRSNRVEGSKRTGRPRTPGPPTRYT